MPARPHLTADNVEELVQAATHRRRADIELWLAQRFPAPEMLAIGPMISRLPSPAPGVPAPPLPPGAVEKVASPAFPPAKATPIAPQRFALHLTIDESLHGKLQRLQELLSHCVPSGDLVQVIERACDLLLSDLEKKKFAATTKPGRPRPSAGARHIPAHVKRAVRKRDQDQCTFVSESGRRCQARKFLEFGSCRSRSARRDGHRGSHPAPMPGPQSVRSGESVRSTVHEGQARAGSTQTTKGKRSSNDRPAAFWLVA